MGDDSPSLLFGAALPVFGAKLSPPLSLFVHFVMPESRLGRLASTLARSVSSLFRGRKARSKFAVLQEGPVDGGVDDEAPDSNSSHM